MILARLDEMKSQLEWGKENLNSPFENLDEDDFKWLIEQAERVDYLEKVYKFETNQHEKYKKIAIEVTGELEDENKRLREALTQISVQKDYGMMDEVDFIEYYERIARQALEDSK